MDFDNLFSFVFGLFLGFLIFGIIFFGLLHSLVSTDQATLACQHMYGPSAYYDQNSPTYPYTQFRCRIDPPVKLDSQTSPESVSLINQS